MFTKINLNNIIMSIIPMSYFVWSTDFTGAVFVLFGLCVLDLLTGIRKAQYLGILSSSIAISRSKKKAMDYLTLLIAGYLVNMFILSLEPTGYIATFIMSFIGEFINYIFILVVAYLIGVEFYSILENLAKIGVPIPKKIINKWSNNIDIICKDKE